jgi:hypothetical protein
MRHLTSRPSSRSRLPLPSAAAGLLLLALILGACAPKNVHPEIAARGRTIRTIGIVRPEVSVYALSAGGQRDLISEWSEAGRNNLLTAAVKGLSGRSTRLEVVRPGEGMAALLDDVRPLAAAVGATVSGQAYLDAPVLDRRGPFVHSVGSLGSEPERNGVDALLVMTAVDEISSAGRRALIAVGKITGLLFGRPPRKGETVISMMLLDRDGAVLWYDELREAGDYDLRSRRSVEKAVGKVLASFPEEVR